MSDQNTMSADLSEAVRQMAGAVEAMIIARVQTVKLTIRMVAIPLSDPWVHQLLMCLGH